MGRGKRNPGCNCCGTDCCQVFDSFWRADSTNLGGDWTEVAGAWEIKDNTLQTSSTNAICLHNTTIGTSQQMWCSVQPAAQGDKFRFLFAYTDASNHIALEVECYNKYTIFRVFVNGTEQMQHSCDSGRDGTILYDWFNQDIVISGQPTVYACWDSSANKLTWIRNWNCYEDRDDFTLLETSGIRVKGSGQYVVTSPPTGQKVGLGTGDTNSGPMAFGYGADFERQQCSGGSNSPFNAGDIASAADTQTGCICCTPCEIAGERWVRPATLIGDTWTGSATGWSSSSALTLSGGSTGKIICNAVSHEPEFVAFTEFAPASPFTDPSTVRLYGGYESASNYLYAEVQSRNDAMPFRLAIGNASGELAAVETVWSHLEPFILILCYDGSQLIAHVTNRTGFRDFKYTAVVESAVTGTYGYQGGIEVTASSGDTVFYQYGYHLHTVDDLRCYTCCNQAVSQAVCSGQTPWWVVIDIAGGGDLYDGTFFFGLNLNLVIGGHIELRVNAIPEGVQVFVVRQDKAFRLVLPGSSIDCLFNGLELPEVENDPPWQFPPVWEVVPGGATATLTVVDVCP